MEKKRLDYLDMVKGFGIFLVVLGHMEDISSTTRIWISSFHMPLFFIVSGLLMAVKNEESQELVVSFKKKWRGIIIPYMWFSLMYFVIDIGNVWIVKNIDLRTFTVDTISSLTFYGMSVLWFLPALFIGSMGFLFLHKQFGRKINCILLIVIALVAYFIKNKLELVYFSHGESLLITSLIHILYVFLRAFIAMSFIGYAYYIRKLVDEAGDKLAFLNNKMVCLFLGSLLLILNFLLGMKNECVDLNNILLNNVLLYYLAAFSGVYGAILIFKALPSISLVKYFGRNSLIVMACHINFYFLYFGLKVAWFVDTYVTRAKHYVFVLVTVTVIFALSTIVIEVIQRFFPFVLGKPMKLSAKNNSCKVH